MKKSKFHIRKIMKIKRKKFYSSNELSPWLASKNFSIKYKCSFSCIAVYWPMIYELDTRPLIKKLLNNNITIALPIIENNNLKFIKWRCSDNLFYSFHKFYYPQNKDTHIVNPKLVIVPLLAYDNLGYRLGYGKGYYDRYFEKNKNINYVGYGFSFQKTESLPVEKYDLKLNSVVTDNYTKDFY